MKFSIYLFIFFFSLLFGCQDPGKISFDDNLYSNIYSEYNNSTLQKLLKKNDLVDSNITVLGNNRVKLSSFQDYKIYVTLQDSKNNKDKKVTIGELKNRKIKTIRIEKFKDYSYKNIFYIRFPN